jgi:hypothetical protein
VGGLLHAFQHFAYKDKSLSTFAKGYNLDYHPSYFILDITNAFFYSKLIETKDKDKKECSLGVYNDINFYFFSIKIDDSKVFFLSTAYFQGYINIKK